MAKEKSTVPKVNEINPVNEFLELALSNESVREKVTY